MAIVVVTREALTKLVALSPTYAVFLEGMFSETHIQFCESLFNRTGAMGRFAARQAANTTHMYRRWIDIHRRSRGVEGQ